MKITLICLILVLTSCTTKATIKPEDCLDYCPEPHKSIEIPLLDW